jgi:putative glutamine amidotransferase
VNNPNPPAVRPRIGITMDVGVPDEGRQTLELPADYARRVFQAGGMPLPLAPTYEPDIRQEMIASLDGLILSGGNDLDPGLYGQAPHPATRPTPKDRQDFDLAILALAEARVLPTLGICMGCQTMNVQRRGTLHQHLPDLPGERLGHRRAGDRSNMHDVEIHPGSRLASVLRLERLTVNSRHHQGIDRVGQGLIPCALAADGLVEALEDPSLAFWLGVQWHPENLGGTPHDRLFEALVEAARASRAARLGHFP